MTGLGGIVASIGGPSVEAALEAALGCVGVADLVEFRLDLFDSIDGEGIDRLVRGSPLPVVAACAGGSGAERLDRLRRAARAGAAFVDADEAIVGGLGAVPASARLVVSWHDFEGAPRELHPIFQRLRAKGGIPKVVTTAHDVEDAFRVLSALRRFGGDAIAFAMGEAGRTSRALAPLYGSRFTYAAAARGRETAPGQWAAAELRALYPAGGPGPKTAVFGVVGNPIGHSISPAVHGAAVRAAGLDAFYLAFEPKRLGTFLGAIEGGPIHGLSVTAPFKGEAARATADVSSEVPEVEAANTLVRHGALWRAYNTDGGAAADAIEAAGTKLSEKTVLVVGAGGAARAIAAACRRRGASVLLAGRNAERVAASAKRAGAKPLALDEVVRTAHDVLIQATPVGTRDPGSMPIPAEAVRAGSVVLDVVYDPPETALLRVARERGAMAIPGIEMFVRQAEGQFRLFTGEEPPRELMRAAARAALARARDS